MKKIFLIKIFTIIIMLVNLSVFKVNASIELEANGIVLMDAITGDVIYSKNPYDSFEPASTTKVMTAILTLENCDLDELVTIGHNPPYAIGSALGIAEGEVYTVRELLYALLLLSGNDCANALAEHVSGSVEEFAKLMTDKAKQLGANNTVFKNPSGLPEKGHTTTPYDLSLIMKAALSYPDFIEISRRNHYFYEDKPYSDGNEKHAYNGNHCINKNSKYYYKYALSGKTGYTIEANHTYTAAAKKDDQILIASFLDAKNKDTQFNDVSKIFDYGFDNFETIKLIKENEILDHYKITDEVTIPLISDSDVYYTKKRDTSTPKFSLEFIDKNISRQPILEGDKLFDGKVIVNNNEVVNLSLLSGINREYTKLIGFKEGIKSIFTSNFILYILIGLLLLVTILLMTIKYKKMR